jgi:anti-sigma regulatory factor (Ser/Thr protein kinase)
VGVSESDVNESIELIVPARATSLSTVRVVVAAAASGVSRTIDAIEDLQLAVDELCLGLLARGGEPRLRLVVTCSPTRIEVRATREGASAARSDDEAALSRAILDALVDEHGESADAAWLVVGPTTRTGGA